MTVAVLVAFAVILVGFTIYSAFGVWHLFAYGLPGDATRLVATGYLVVSGVVVFFSLLALLANILV